jgi:hypothetical protein
MNLELVQQYLLAKDFTKALAILNSVKDDLNHASYIPGIISIIVCILDQQERKTDILDLMNSIRDQCVIID